MLIKSLWQCLGYLSISNSSLLSAICLSAIINFTTTSYVNNSVIFQCRKVPKVTNERYYNLVLIFGVVWGNGVKGYFCTVFLHHNFTMYFGTVFLHHISAPYFCTVFFTIFFTPYFCTIYLHHIFALYFYTKILFFGGGGGQFIIIIIIIIFPIF